LNMVTSGLGAPTDAAGGILAHTLSPLAAYEIGQYFKGEGAEGGAAHILAHMVLSGAVAAAGGQDVLSAALAAGGAEGFKP
ncbi:MAG: hypothetical protein FWH15_09875, partial [Betaproteobacteria bacterium]|nr:hypothetical protein [Betaproteobacteria bacterium]